SGPPRLLSAARLGIDGGIDRNLIAHNGFPGLAVADLDLLDLWGKLLPSHRTQAPLRQKPTPTALALSFRDQAHSGSSRVKFWACQTRGWPSWVSVESTCPTTTT